MSKHVQIWIALLMTGILCLLAPLRAAQEAGDDGIGASWPAGTIAVVNGEPVKHGEFCRSLARTLGARALDSYLDRVLVEQAAAEQGLAVTDAEIRRRSKLEIRLRMRQVYQHARMTPDEFQRAAKNYGWQPEHAREEIASTISSGGIKLQLLMEKLLRERIEISEPELREYYRWTRGERLAGAHIVVGSTATARKVVEELRNDPGSWRDMVRKHSLDRGSVPYGGRIIPVPADTGMGRVLAQLQRGQIRLYPDGENWHILRLLSRVEAGEQTYEECRDDLQRELFALKAKNESGALLARLQENSTVITNVAANERERAILGNDVVAYVNGEPIRAETFGETLLQQFGPQLLDPFIERKLIFQKARDENVHLSDDAIQKRQRELVDEICERERLKAGISQQEFERSLRKEGTSMKQFRERVKRELVSISEVRALLLAEKMVGGEVTVSESDVEDEYRSRYGRHINVRRLVVESEERARSLRRRALEGASFRLLIQTSSRESLSWAGNGLVRGITPDHPYYPHVRTLRTGQISPVFERNGRYLLLKVISQKKPDNPPPLDSVREELSRAVQQQKTRERIRAWLQKLKAESRIQLLRQLDS